MLEKFAQYLRAVRGYSENTIRAYSNDLRSFAQWAKVHKPEAKWSTISREDIDAYLAHQQEQGMKATTTNRQLSAIASLYRYFQRQGWLNANPCQYESRRKQEKTVPATIPAKQLAMAYKKAQGLKKTILGILCTTGIRIQELLDMKWEDIDFSENTIRIMGKGSKERIVTTEPFVLSQLKQQHERFNPSGKMFWISQRTARYLVYEALEPYCHSSQLNPHAIRHTFATELAKQGENAMTISKILGHSHIETSQKYVDMNQLNKSHKGIIIN